MVFEKITESESSYQQLEEMTFSEILNNINKEDQSIALSVYHSMSQIEALVEQITNKLSNGGRLFYIGAGTSGRLGILDASECPPTFGVPDEMVIGLIAGGDIAIRKAVEDAEDSTIQGWLDLEAYHISTDDVLVGIAASGTTPYVVSTLEKANENNIITGCITMNPGSPLAQKAQYPIVVKVGPEFVTGSSRMKAGTAQKMVLNMLTTTAMIKLGRVKGNKMVDMQLTNKKLIDRGTKMIMNELHLPYETSENLLLTYGSVRNAVLNYLNEQK